VAGTGAAGNSDGTGFATGATLDCPIATAVDNAGNLYIADQVSGDLRAVDTTGHIRTLVPHFSNPWDLNFHNGTLYVVGRFGNCTIDTVDTSDGTVSPMLGTGGTCSDSNTTLSDPSSLTFNAAGDMYITAPHANIVRKFPHGGGPLTTVAGTGTRGFGGDGGAASAALLADPDQVAFDAAGDYFITDWGKLRRQGSDARRQDSDDRRYPRQLRLLGRRAGPPTPPGCASAATDPSRVASPSTERETCTFPTPTTTPFEPSSTPASGKSWA
jgi:hypothetical protein